MIYYPKTCPSHTVNLITLDALLTQTIYLWQRDVYVNPCLAEVFIDNFRHLKLELLTQFPASNDENNLYLCKIDISQTVLFH